MPTIREGDLSKDMIHAWSLGVKFYEKRKNKRVPAKAKVYLEEPRQIRMDVYDPMGFVNLGTLIINGDQMSLDVINQDKYIGPINRRKIQSLLKVNVAPEDLFSLFTQSGFEDKHWDCAVGVGNLLRSCESAVDDIYIKWSGPMTQIGTELELDHTRAKINFRVKSYKAVAKPETKLFKL